MYILGVLKLYRKGKSLSIGEHIATAVANIYRHFLIAPVIDRFACCKKHFGYVDDTFSVLIARPGMELEFKLALDEAIAPMKWVHCVHNYEQDFLDISIHADVVEDIVCFDFHMYRKPSFRPHYLASISNHPKAHKLGIYQCEANRALACCSKATWYEDCMQDIAKFVAVCGYPLPRFPALDENEFSNKRSCLFEKLRSRGNHNSASCPRIDGQFVVQSKALAASRDIDVKHQQRCKLYCVLPYSPQAKQLRIASLFQSCFSDIAPCKLQVAWSIKTNSFRRLAALNRPV
jgi:hypothetical protein